MRETSARSLLRSATPLIGIVALGALTLGSAWADDADPPGVAARLSYAEGAVSIQPAGVDQWAAADVNRPFTTGDRLWTDQDSRAELQLGPLAIRLAQTTGFTFLDLSDSTVQMQVTAGTLAVHVPQLVAGQSIEIDTPTLAVAVEQPGDYRIEVNDRGDSTTVKVIAGDAEVNGAGQTIPLHTQQQGTFAVTGGLTAGIVALGSPDDFDSWCFERNRREMQARQAIGNYVSPEVTGYEDLDQYGTWRSVPEYGYVWYPAAVPVGWAPYRVGHWVWIDPWGWTWVDAQPWGYAPFHYGRWAYLDRGWCWVPGPRHLRPVYAPALVAWFGAGAAVTLSLASGPSVAWFPLAPRDVYVPPYRVSNTYIRNVNITNTTIINNTYITNVIANGGRNYRSVNQRIPGAVTAVPRTVFTSAQPVAPHVIHVTPTSFRSARVSPTPPAIAPVRASVLGAGAAAGRRARVPPSRVIDRPVVALKMPPPAPVPFDRARQAIVANGGRPLPPTQLARLRPKEAPQSFRSARQPPGREAVPFTAPGRPRAPQTSEAPRAERAAPQEFRAPPPPRTERPPPREFRAPSAPRSDRPPSQEFRAPPTPRSERPPPQEFRAPSAPRVERPPPQEFRAPPVPRSERPPPQEFRAQPAPRIERPPPQEFRAPSAPRVERPPPREFRAPPAPPRASQAAPRQEASPRGPQRAAPERRNPQPPQ